MRNKIYYHGYGWLIGMLAMTSLLSAADYTTQGWAHKQNVVLNTSSNGGANSTAEVTNFPVLVRLDEGNFDFTQAQSTGADVRFTNAAFDTLVYEIESWNATAKTAALWVRVNRIAAQNETQYIVMYWGAFTGAATPSRSNGKAVFDTAKGFAGVWHMNETPAANADPIENITGFSNNGMWYGTISPETSVYGIAGKAIYFNGTDNYVEVPNNPSIDFDSTRSFTFSAWVKTNQRIAQQTIHLDSTCTSIDLGDGELIWDCTYHDTTIITGNYSNNGRIITKRNGPWYSLTLDAEGGHVTLEQTNSENIGSHNINKHVNDGSWYLIAGTIDRATGTARLYVDSSNESRAYTLSNSSPANLLLGTWQNQWYCGTMDEVRIESVARDSNWIQLCYQNQKPEQTLVKLPLRPGVGILNPGHQVIPGSGFAMQGKVQLMVFDLQGKKMFEHQCDALELRRVVSRIQNSFNKKNICLMKVSSVDTKRVLLQEKLVLFGKR